MRIYSKMIKILDSKSKTRNLTLEEQKAGENVCKNCMGIKKGEKVLIVTDKDKEKIEAPIFFESAKNFTNKVKMVVFKPTGQHGLEAPKKVINLMCESNVALMPTTYSLSHTLGRQKASNSGARIASMPGITRDIILRTLSIDYYQVSKLSKKIAGLMTTANIAHLTSENGASILLPLQGRDALADTGLYLNPGSFGNLPAGEAFIAPLEGKSNGIIIFEKVLGSLKLTAPLAVEVKHGKVVNIKGKQSFTLLRTLEKIGSNAHNIAELGVGTNKTAKLGTNLLEIEKVYGTCHIALGNNAYFGGEVDLPYHEDGIILNPTLKLDNKTIIKDGKFLI